MRYIGKDGVVDVGAQVVGEVRSFEVNVTRPVAEAAAMGRDWAGHDTGAQRATGSVTCWADAEDAGQAALVDGAHVALTLQPQGVGSTLPQIAFTDVVITERPLTVERDSYAEITFSWAANSALDETPQT